MQSIDPRSQDETSRSLINSRIQAVLDHGQTIMGPEVAELEQRLADYTGARHCITASSGTTALAIALMALGVGPGDDVITTPFAASAAAKAIVLVGARPVFADIERATCTLDPQLIEAAITPATRAVISVSLYGQPPDMDAINGIAARHGLAVIEDGAQSFGATYRGRQSGNLSTIGCTSFFPTNPLGCYGDGGALFTNDDALAGAMRDIRVRRQARRHAHHRFGHDACMETLQCAIVLARLERFDWDIRQRRRIAAAYDEMLQPHLPVIGCCSDRTSACAGYAVLVEQREQVRAILAHAGVPTAVHYPVPVHRQPAYARLAAEASCPVADAMAASLLSLPIGPHLAAANVRHGVQCLLHATGPLQARVVESVELQG
ncbi:UDP-2-acetamido-2-deoxy-ribo-hexuluronate aminotransferase [Massilia aurea]|uniref:UDP-2-acetamido-2-deoxy-ribo-hexuluronate aminotransferase n=1 Tax=Massilia aurea TaxID=373040 RepID=A0A7W9WXL4_9BURK|nr:DegT/DnrJ/EryC1/StrS family aminotransferase [Massilia aurea]MBB6132691.1 UDP-2-acetamido-2-deoxy-ribo-hexuluronate aminotransferase [Massilia aurea]